jgi:hypothetical protein
MTNNHPARGFAGLRRLQIYRRKGGPQSRRYAGFGNYSITSKLEAELCQRFLVFSLMTFEFKLVPLAL